MIRSFAAVAISALALSASAADLTITFKSSDGGTATQYFTKDRVRFNSGRSDTMMEFSSGKLVTIDHQKKEYSEMTLAEIDEAMKGAAAQMEQAMAQVPPQMREQMARMMGGAAAEVTVAKGGTQTVAGYSCQTYTISMGSTMTQETCNTTALTPPFDPANLQKLSRISMPMMQGMEKFIEKMKEIQGLSLKEHTTVSMMGRKNETNREATEVKTGPIGDEVFAMPAGYKKTDSPLKNLGRRGR